MSASPDDEPLSVHGDVEPAAAAGPSVSSTSTNGKGKGKSSRAGSCEDSLKNTIDHVNDCAVTKMFQNNLCLHGMKIGFFKTWECLLQSASPDCLP